MVDQEQLRKRALRAYELGRVRMSSRVLLFLLPLGIACVLLSDNRKVCASLAILIVGLAMTLRWLDKRGVEAVDIGLKAAMLPLAVSIVLMQLGHSSSPALAISACSVAGALAGAWTGYQLGRARADVLVWLSSASVALVAAALGAVDLGAGGLIGLASSYIASGVIAASVVRFRARPLSQNV